MAKPIILFTGFAPFGSFIKNSSWETVRVFKHSQANIVKLCLPVDFNTSQHLLYSEIRRIKPDYVFCSGMQFSNQFSIETCMRMSRGLISVSSNVDECKLQDIQNIVNNVYDTGLSKNAQGYICEHVGLYLFKLVKKYKFEGYFIHVPTFEKCPLKIHKKWWSRFFKCILKYSEKEKQI